MTSPDDVRFGLGDLMANVPDISLIIPAHNEADVLPGCLRAAVASDGPSRVQIIVVANGCSDETAARARGAREMIEARGWSLDVIDREQGGKPGALTAGDAIARAPVRAYLDADVVLSPDLLAQITARLSNSQPLYASGRLEMPKPKTWVTRAYRRIYAQVPFITQGVPGAGFFATNAAGRARWDDWPEIISDDTFARLNFAPNERVLVPASYAWPLVEGWSALVRVRRRQNAGVAEIGALFPALLANDNKPKLPFKTVLRMALKDPVGFAIYGGVALSTKLGRSTSWERGR